MSRANACTMNDDWWLWWIGAPPPGFCTMTLALAVSGVGALAKVGPGGVGLGRAKWEDLGIRVWERVPPLPACVRRHQQPQSRSLHGDLWPSGSHWSASNSTENLGRGV